MLYKSTDQSVGSHAMYRLPNTSGSILRGRTSRLTGVEEYFCQLRMLLSLETWSLWIKKSWKIIAFVVVAVFMEPYSRTVIQHFESWSAIPADAFGQTASSKIIPGKSAVDDLELAVHVWIIYQSTNDYDNFIPRGFAEVTYCMWFRRQTSDEQCIKKSRGRFTMSW